MSSIKLTADSGGGTFEIKAPASSGNTRVLTLPDAANGTVLTTTNPKTGNILQVVSSIKTDTFSVVSNETEQEVTNLNATITPTSNTSKILVMVSLTYSANGTTYKGRIKRGSTTIFQGDASGSKQQAAFGLGFTGDENQADVASFTGLDSPATPSATTYKVFVVNDNSESIFINRSRQDNNDNRGGRHVSTVTLMEVSA